MDLIKTPGGSSDAMALDQHSALSPPITLEALAPAFLAAAGGGEPTPAQHAFLASVLEDYRPDELPGIGPDDLGAVLAAFWAHGEAFKGPAPAARLIRDLGLDLLEIVQRDAPFLVDSVMGAVADWGGEVQAMFHPLVSRDGARLSTIQVWLAPVAEERRAGLLDLVLEAASDVHLAVADFPAMLALLARATGELIRAQPGDPAALKDDIEFLRWMEDGHFVFLGARIYDYPRTPDGGYAAEEPAFTPEDCLGVLRDQGRLVLRRNEEPAVLSAALKYRIEAPEPVIVAKSNLRSKVHRRAVMDYI